MARRLLQRLLLAQEEVLMIGKPNLPDDGDARPDLRGAARATPGLAALDEEREASMADEGGVSGAVMESEDEAAVPHVLRPPKNAGDSRRQMAFYSGAAAGLMLGAWMVRRRLR
jgi:hypothetical protein